MELDLIGVNLIIARLSKLFVKFPRVRIISGLHVNLSDLEGVASIFSILSTPWEVQTPCTLQFNLHESNKCAEIPAQKMPTRHQTAFFQYRLAYQTATLKKMPLQKMSLFSCMRGKHCMISISSRSCLDNHGRFLISLRTFCYVGHSKLCLTAFSFRCLATVLPFPTIKQKSYNANVVL